MNMTTDEVIKYLEYADDFMRHNADWHDREAIDLAIEALKREKWIPVSEKLPEEDAPVLIQKDCSCLVDEHYGRAVGMYDGDKYWTVEDDFYAEPIAWMPLPKPYKENNE